MAKQKTGYTSGGVYTLGTRQAYQIEIAHLSGNYLEKNFP
jgi:hypothetical protein